MLTHGPVIFFFLLFKTEKKLLEIFPVTKFFSINLLLSLFLWKHKPCKCFFLLSSLLNLLVFWQFFLCLIHVKLFHKFTMWFSGQPVSRVTSSFVVFNALIPRAPHYLTAAQVFFQWLIYFSLLRWYSFVSVHHLVLESCRLLLCLKFIW